jgi:hypothetical protein
MGRSVVGERAFVARGNTKLPGWSLFCRQRISLFAAAGRCPLDAAFPQMIKAGAAALVPTKYELVVKKNITIDFSAIGVHSRSDQLPTP